MRMILIFINKTETMAELMIMFRETLEMSLIIGIVSTYLIKPDNKSFFSVEKKMHDIDKPITLEDLTNPDKD